MKLALFKGTRNLSKLVKKHITNKLGHQTTVWVRMFADDELPSKAPVGHTLMELGGMIFTKYSDKAFSITGSTKENIELIREVRETLGVGSWGGKTKAWYFPLSSTPHVFGMMQAKLDAQAQKEDAAGEVEKSEGTQAAADKAQAIKLGIALGTPVLLAGTRGAGKIGVVTGSSYNDRLNQMEYSVTVGTGVLKGLQGHELRVAPEKNEKKIEQATSTATPETRVAVENALFGAGDLADVPAAPKYMTAAEIPAFTNYEEARDFINKRAGELKLSVADYYQSDEGRALGQKISDAKEERRRKDAAAVKAIDAAFDAMSPSERLKILPTSVDTEAAFDAWLTERAKHHDVSLPYYRGTSEYMQAFSQARTNILVRTQREAKEKLAAQQEGTASTIDTAFGKQEYVAAEAFKPKVAKVKLGELGEVSVTDYSHFAPKDVKTVSAKSPLLNTYPAYMPEISEDTFKTWGMRMEAVKVAPDRFLIEANGTLGMYRYGAQRGGASKYVLVNTAQLAAMQDFMKKRMAAAAKASVPEGMKPRVKRGIASNKITYGHIALIEGVFGKIDRTARHEKFKEVLDIVTRRTNDLEIDREYDEHTYTKGEETSYGDGGTKDDLLADYGVKVKRQNGDEITKPYIDDIKAGLDKVFGVYGKSPELAKAFGLKVSHAGEMHMHASTAAGVYYPAKRAIGIGNAGAGAHLTLAHEWAHFLDHQLGSKEQHRHISDNPNHPASTVADTFRRLMAAEAKSATVATGKYWTRTCECFARAMEQYFVRKTDGAEGEAKLLKKYAMGGFVSPEKFAAEVEPLIASFLKTSAPLIKSIAQSARFIIRR